jgi:hypothetical protein
MLLPFFTDLVRSLAKKLETSVMHTTLQRQVTLSSNSLTFLQLHSGVKLYQAIQFPDMASYNYDSFQMTDLEAPVLYKPNRGRPKAFSPLKSSAKEQFCGKCGKPGHNKRSCKVPEGMIASSSSSSSSSASSSLSTHQKQVTYPKCFLLARLGSYYFQELAASEKKSPVVTKFPMSAAALQEILSLVDLLKGVEPIHIVSALYFLLQVSSILHFLWSYFFL